jgi:putative colanic acid biosynthesis glycosyltransferase
MNRGKPFLSIITVVLNDVDGLKRTMESIVSQQFQDLEWVAVDGGSIDGTIEFLSQYKEDTIKFISARDRGIYDAMNKGVELCKAEYVLFLNAGDFFSHTSVLRDVKTCIQACLCPPDILFGGATLVFSSGIRWYRACRRIETYIWHGLPAMHQATFFKHNRLQNTKYDISYRICGDYYIAAKLYKKGITVSYLDESLVDFVVGGTSYKNKRKMLIEPFFIQRDVLELDLLRRVISLTKRIISITGVMVFSQPILSLFFRHMKILKKVS